MTETITIFRLLGDAKTRIGAVKKEETNQAQHFNFRGIDAVVNAVAPVFNDLGIITVPEVQEHQYDTVIIGAKQTQMGHVNLIVKYTFYSPEGDSVAAVVASESMDSGDKCTAKAMSVAYRTALLQVLNLPTDEPDPDAESYERSTPGAKAPKPVKDIRPWNKRIAEAASKDELNIIWKDAGAVGELGKDITTPDGKMTVQQLLYKRADELALKSGAKSPNNDNGSN
jgi:hypothetical protein